MRHVVEIEVAQMDLGRLEHAPLVLKALPRQLRRAVGEPADDELMEVRVVPAEGSLQDVVQLG